jgi:hypothetical protein
MAHTHPCDVATCGEPAECEGYVKSDGIDGECLLQESDAPSLCDTHREWVRCHHCEAWYDPNTCDFDPPACSQGCADALFTWDAHDEAAHRADAAHDSAKEDAA